MWLSNRLIFFVMLTSLIVSVCARHTPQERYAQSFLTRKTALFSKLSKRINTLLSAVDKQIQKEPPVFKECSLLYTQLEEYAQQLGDVRSDIAAVQTGSIYHRMHGIPSFQATNEEESKRISALSADRLARLARNVSGLESYIYQKMHHLVEHVPALKTMSTAGHESFSSDSLLESSLENSVASPPAPIRKMAPPMRVIKGEDKKVTKDPQSSSSLSVAHQIKEGAEKAFTVLRQGYSTLVSRATPVVHQGYKQTKDALVDTGSMMSQAMVDGYKKAQRWSQQSAHQVKEWAQQGRLYVHQTGKVIAQNASSIQAMVGSTQEKAHQLKEGLVGALSTVKTHLQQGYEHLLEKVTRGYVKLKEYALYGWKWLASSVAGFSFPTLSSLTRFKATPTEEPKQKGEPASLSHLVRNNESDVTEEKEEPLAFATLLEQLKRKTSQDEHEKPWETIEKTVPHTERSPLLSAVIKNAEKVKKYGADVFKKVKQGGEVVKDTIVKAGSATIDFGKSLFISPLHGAASSDSSSSASARSMSFQSEPDSDNSVRTSFWRGVDYVKKKVHEAVTSARIWYQTSIDTVYALG